MKLGHPWLIVFYDFWLSRLIRGNWIDDPEYCLKSEILFNQMENHAITRIDASNYIYTWGVLGTIQLLRNNIWAMFYTRIKEIECISFDNTAVCNENRFIHQHIWVCFSVRVCVHAVKMAWVYHCFTKFRLACLCAQVHTHNIYAHSQAHTCMHIQHWPTAVEHNTAHTHACMHARMHTRMHAHTRTAQTCKHTQKYAIWGTLHDLSFNIYDHSLNINQI